MNIKAKDKIRGIVYAYTNEKRYDLVHELGIDHIRLNIPFPWKDKINGQVSDRWLRVKTDFEEAVNSGLKVMPSTPTILGYKEEICGKYGTDEFYNNVRRSTEFMARDLGALAAPLWQCMNELDIPTFSGTVPLDICAEACRQSARGILDVNPEAICGTNFASWREESRRVGEMLFSGNHPFGYVGNDQYFGSWQGGSIDDWPGVLDSIWDAFGLPILVNEWGYSSRGKTLTHEQLINLEGNTENLEPVCFHKAWCNEMPGGHNEEVQADYIRHGLEIFASHPKVLGNFIFCFSDAHTCWHCGKPDCPAECYWGICDANCNPKPAFYAAKEAIHRLYF